jgi:hypothetical protein
MNQGIAEYSISTTGEIPLKLYLRFNFVEPSVSHLRCFNRNGTHKTTS